jgi:multidrug resistance efflux pump
MRTVALLLTLVGIVLTSGCGGPGAAPQIQASEPESASSWLQGKTQPAPGHVAKIAPAALHPVVEVKFAVGDRVKKDQELVKLDDDEPQADVRAKKAACEELKAALARLREEPRLEEQNEARAYLTSLKVSSDEARQTYARLEPLFRSGAIAEQRYHEARHNLAKVEADQVAATARLARLQKRPFEREVAELQARIKAAEEAVKGAEAELEHYTVVAQIDGIVSSLQVCPGMVSRPGTTEWGEILDLSVIDVRCEVTSEQADALRIGQLAEIRSNGRTASPLTGKIASIGIAADQKTGRIPVLVRLDNPDNRLRCYVDVKVRFQ